MHSFWLVDETLNAGLGEAQPGAAVAQPSWTETRSPFLVQMEQILGEKSTPDAAFLVDSWTVGIAAAAENFHRRHVELKRSEQEIHIWNSFSFTPLILTQEEPLAEVARPLRKVSVEEDSTLDPPRISDEEENQRQMRDEIELVCPLTPESACQVLGVGATSTRNQIRAAYRKMASRYHPDRRARGEAREQKLASDHMAYLNEAYRLLCVWLDRRPSLTQQMSNPVM